MNLIMKEYMCLKNLSERLQELVVKILKFQGIFQLQNFFNIKIQEVEVVGFFEFKFNLVYVESQLRLC